MKTRRTTERQTNIKTQRKTEPKGTQTHRKQNECHKEKEIQK